MRAISQSFSRTPRGFEADLVLGSRERTGRLSAEPLVGLKRSMNSSKRSRGEVFELREETDAALSAEPLVGLKRSRLGSVAELVVLSAEPLVGLKPVDVKHVQYDPYFQPNPSWV